MTIAELLVKIGFSVTNPDALPKVEERLKKGALDAAKYAIALDAAATALTLVTLKAINAALNLNKFRYETGENTDTLQKWQYAARKAVGTGADVAGAIKSIQDAQAGIALGEGNIAPWQLLGIDPRTDPFQVLWQIHQKILELSAVGKVGVARHIASQFGINDDLFAFLARADLKLNDLNSKWMITRQQETDLVALNAEWQEFEQHVEMIGIKVAHTLHPAFTNLIPAVEKILEKIADWTVEIQKPEHKQFRDNLVKIAETLLVAAPAVTALAATFKALSLALGLVNPELVIAAASLKLILDTKNLLDHPTDRAAQQTIKDWIGNIGNAATSGLITGFHPILDFKSAFRDGPRTSTTSVTVHVNSPDPQQAGASVVSALTKHLTGALNQSPVPGQ